MIPKNRFVSITETQRTYVYPDESFLAVSRPTRLMVRDSGFHYLEAEGRKHIIAPGWRQIVIDGPWYGED